ncbi:DUF1439 domain-containing protein [Rugamonas sp. CCM 8940]|uniref:DUF1439 domain-containing protein n=1 Tax=Rugamonas sp. CCM 8940 TaxID=2765359 RepID=UPI0018F27AAC|nr:DUF1439 domain-containing protein [Rugamonas sp. CCM 8940]MBJ7312928.1 DUF1439 domain-containing protein [Rugamonas sp. CCM 8940]
MNGIHLFSSRRKRLGLAALAATLLASCSTLIGPRQVELPLERLQQGLDKRFPLRQRVLAIFDVELSRPRLDILDCADCISLELDTAVSPLLGRQSWQGNMLVSGRLQVDRAHNAVMLRDARIDRFMFRQLDNDYQYKLAPAGKLLAELVARDIPVYRFRPEDLRYGGVQFELTGISTKPGGLVVTLAPAP